jgi:hypothetical protein
MEKPGKPPVSVCVENTPNYRPVRQNTAGLHLTYRRMKHFKSSSFLPHIYPIRHLQTLPEHQYETLFSEGCSKKKGFGKK